MIRPAAGVTRQFADAVDSRLGVSDSSTAYSEQPASVLELYQEALRKRGFEPDDSQYAAVLRLQQLYEEWSDYKRQRSTRCAAWWCGRRCRAASTCGARSGAARAF